MVLGRATKIFKVLEFFGVFDRFLNDAQLTGSKRNIFVTAIFMCLLLHILACCWYATGSIATLSGSQSWIQKDNAIDSNSLTFWKYFRSLYFAVLTSFTVGYGGIVPYSVAEKIVVVLLILSGTSFYFLVMALITVWAEQSNRVALEFEKKYEVIKHCLSMYTHTLCFFF